MSYKPKNKKINSYFLSLVIFGVVFSPFVANANLLASLFGGSASASSRELISQTERTNNVQNISLLEASPFLVFGEGEEELELSDNALLPPVGLLRDQEEEDKTSPLEQISVYVVRSGDTLSRIAEMFDVSVNTIVWANDLKGKKVSPGETLIILPVSGVRHIIKKGDTLKSLATQYKVSVEDILEYNSLDTGTKLSLGEELIIPGGQILPKPTVPKQNSSSPSNIASLKNTNISGVDVGGYFAHPLPGSRRVRGLTRTHKGVDFAAPTGTPIYAAASGRVIFAKYGWNGRYGNMVIVSHNNGTRTLYAHMSEIGTTQGAEVAKGQVIGYVGNTGRSTGPHLHFEVLGARNPF